MDRREALSAFLVPFLAPLARYLPQWDTVSLRPHVRPAEIPPADHRPSLDPSRRVTVTVRTNDGREYTGYAAGATCTVEGQATSGLSLSGPIVGRVELDDMVMPVELDVGDRFAMLEVGHPDWSNTVVVADAHINSIDHCVAYPDAAVRTNMTWFATNPARRFRAA